jgi:hypothetical protein
VTINVANLGSVDAITLSDALTHAVSLTGLPAATTITQKNTNTAGLTYTLADATGADDALNIVMSNAGNTFAAGSHTAAGIETINITATDSSPLAADQIGVHTATLVAANATALNITGNAGMTLTSTGSAKIATMDASAVTGTTSNVTYTSANVTAGQTPVITGGAGADVLTGAALAETISGGAGNDTIEGNTGIDTLNGGAGNDTFDFTNAELLGTDIVSGGEGTDVINMEDASSIVDADFANVTSVETLTLLTNAIHTVVLGANSLAAGINTVTGLTGGVNTITVGAGHAGNVAINNGTANDVITVSGVPAGNTLTIDGGAGNDTFNLGPATEIITGGTGNDTFAHAAVASLTAGDVLNGTSGTDTISFAAAGTITDAMFTGVSNMDVLGTFGASTITLGGQAVEGGILTVELGNAAVSTTNTFDGTAMTTGLTKIQGGTGVDIITGTPQADAFDLGIQGADAWANGAGVIDVIKFAATGATNGNDTFLADNDVRNVQFDFSAFNTGMTFNGTKVEAATGAADINITNKITMVITANGTVTLTDDTTKVANLIQGIGDALHLNSGGKAVIVGGDDSAATAGAQIYYVDDTLDGVNGTVSATDVVQVATLSLDVDTLSAGNFI